MKEPEDILKEIKRVRAPESLDRTVSGMIDDVSCAKHPIVAFPVPLWACALACLVFLFAGMMLKKSEQPASPPPNVTNITYVVKPENDPVFRKMFIRNGGEHEYFLRGKEIIEQNNNEFPEHFCIRNSFRGRR